MEQIRNQNRGEARAEVDFERIAGQQPVPIQNTCVPCVFLCNR